MGYGGKVSLKTYFSIMSNFKDTPHIKLVILSKSYCCRYSKIVLALIS